MSAHTPGPWEAVSPMRAIGITGGPDGRFICHIAGTSEFGVLRSAEADANARLIAAAPSMYDAIREALENCETCRDDGQPNCCRCLTFAGIVRCIDGEEAQR